MSARRLGLVLLASLNVASVRGYNGSLLDRGDAAVLAPPVANFQAELQRINVSPPPFQPPPEPVEDFNWTETNVAIEVEDLRAALEKAGRSADAVERITTNFLAQREQLNEFKRALEAWEDPSRFEQDENGNLVRKPAVPRPTFPKIKISDELPAEFIEYLQGIAAWQNPAFKDKSVARAAWERILNRPADERRFKSTWAAFMLGKSWEKQKPDKAIESYEKVRTLATAGFPDSAGLAYASLGWEARVYLNQTNYERATELYLQQWAAGDDSAYASLCFTMRRLFRGGTDQFPALAKNPRTRRVVTAYIVSTKALRICTDYIGNSNSEISNRLFHVVNDWLSAVDGVEEKDAETVEELALAAYQNGQWETAQSWIARTRPSPTIQWLQAKLLLRAGKSDEAGALLTRAERLFTSPSSGTNAPMDLKDNLNVPTSEYDYEGIAAAEQIRGELGIYRLARGEYAAALDCFLRGDFWKDAAYVAERVLTPEELKSYVDSHWPAEPLLQSAAGNHESEVVADPFPEQGEKIRYLLARRLTREIRGNEARDYFPAEWQPQFDALVDSLSTGWNESLPPDQRAKALFTAAHIARSDGMDLLGTEVAPDWHLYDGDDTGRLSSNWRTNANFTLFPATPDELRRDAEHKPDPDARFHYRYQAAFLAWEAAKLMPNNSDETARVLWTAGSWLKARDPQTADIFYKSLVRRCRQTALGAEADRRRWFPSEDEVSDIVSTPSPPEDSMSSAAGEEVVQDDEATREIVSDYPVPGGSYMIHAGDSLSSIAGAASVLGRPITVRDIFEANPGLDTSRLRVGQKLVIPTTNQDPTPE